MNTMQMTVAAILFGTSAAIAGGPPGQGGTPPPFQGDEGETFSQSGSGDGSGGTFSSSTTQGFSSTGVIGNGSAEQSSFSGAAQTDGASFEAGFEDGRVSIESDTISQGETLSSSDGFTTGDGFGETGAIANREGNAWSGGEFETEFTFGEQTGEGTFNPPGNPFN